MTLDQNLEQEHLVQEHIFDAINKFNSFCFNAGAGAGKTYALVESIKYIINNKQYVLRKNNQKIICITYTNVAVNEIKKHLGNTQFVLVSTIHKMLWELIKLYQKNELIDLHKEKLNFELIDIQKKINKYRDDKNISVIFPKKDKFISLINETKEIFYKIKNSSAEEFKLEYKRYEFEHNYLPNALKNINNFKKFVELCYKEERYKKAIDKINDPKERKKIKIQYDSKSNSEQLTSMKFSHDTLLEYSYSLVDRYPIFRRIIVDKYPYIFIDEYQDTHENVITLVQKLHQYSRENHNKWLVGYFGDTKQNIYNDGIGSNILTIHPNIEYIYKLFNRRAHLQLTNLINKIRDDDIHQVPIDPSRTNGNIQFYHLQNPNENNRTNKIQKFIEQFKNIIPQDQKIDCLVPISRSLASLGGFETVYNSIFDSKFIYWVDLNFQFLSHQLEKLHPAVLTYYYLIMFYKKLKNRNTTYFELLGKTNNDITFENAKKTIKLLTDMKANTLKELLKSISCIIQENDASYTNSTIQYCLNNSLSINYSDIKLYDSFYEYMKDIIYEKMFKNQNKNEDENIKKDNNLKIQEILNIDLTEWLNWVSFINEERGRDSKVIYHTYHGTKGEEYDNVAIIMGHDFGSKDKNKFKKYFSHIQLSQEEQDRKLQDEEYAKQLKNTQNLIYVACSRAKRNLQILYLDDISDILKGIQTLFDNIKEFN